MNKTITSSEHIVVAVSGNKSSGKSDLIHRLEQYLPTSPDHKKNHSRQDCNLPETHPLTSNTGRRHFSIVEISGAEDFGRMFGESLSPLGAVLIVVDPTEGFGSQARQTAVTAFVFGSQRIMLVVDKIDTADYDSSVFLGIQERFDSLSNRLKIHSSSVIPLCSQEGQNIGNRPNYMPWYQGPTLADCLEKIRVENSPKGKLLIAISSPGKLSPQRWLQGRILQGTLQAGDQLRVASSGKTAVVEDITTSTARTHPLVADLIRFKLDKSIEVRSGDILSLANTPIETTDHFEAIIIWNGEEEGLVGRLYGIQIGAQRTTGSITAVKNRFNTDTLALEACTTLTVGNVYACNIATNTQVVFGGDANSKQLSSFSLFTDSSNTCLGHGTIKHSLRRASNVHKQALAISRTDRETLNCHRGKVIWFTGLSGSGKSTIANALEVTLHGQGYRTYILDGDNIRHGLNKDLGFTDADRVENIRRIAEVAKLMMDAGLIVMTAFISPFRRERDMARNLIGADSFIEVYVSTSLEVCEKRDVKGLYKKARSGSLPNLTGVDSPYEAPECPDVEVDCDHWPIQKTIAVLMEKIAPANSGVSH